MARGYSHAPGASPDVERAASANLTPDDVATMGRSKNEVVRELIAQRLDCPFGLMVALAHDPVEAVRVAVGANPRAAHAVLEHLSHDKSLEVLQAVISNPSLSSEILEQLVFHRRPEIRDAAARRLDAPGLHAVRREDARTPELRDIGSGVREYQLSLVQDLEEDDEPTMALAATGTSDAAPAPHRTAPVRGFRIDK